MRILKKSQCPTFALLFLLGIAQIFEVAGQSGRRPPPEKPAKPTELQLAWIPDPNRDEYQLVFTKGYEELRKEKKKLDVEQQWQQYAAGFIDELNRVGARGYQVTSIALSPRLAVLRRSDAQYEYALIRITNRKRRFDGDAQFGPKYLSWAQKGFRVADYFVLDNWCTPGQWDDEYGGLEPIDCVYYSQVLLERKKSAEPPRRYAIVNAHATFNKEKQKAQKNSKTYLMSHRFPRIGWTRISTD